MSEVPTSNRHGTILQRPHSDPLVEVLKPAFCDESLLGRIVMGGVESGLQHVLRDLICNLPCEDLAEEKQQTPPCVDKLRSRPSSACSA